MVDDRVWFELHDDLLGGPAPTERNNKVEANCELVHVTRIIPNSAAAAQTPGERKVVRHWQNNRAFTVFYLHLTRLQTIVAARNVVTLFTCKLQSSLLRVFQSASCWARRLSADILRQGGDGNPLLRQLQKRRIRLRCGTFAGCFVAPSGKNKRRADE